MTDILSKAIREARSSLGDSSIRTYVSVLNSLHKKIFGGSLDLDNFKKTQKILDDLKNMPCNRRKTILSALVVLTGNKDFREQMADDVAEYNRQIDKQEKTPEQEASWVTTADVKSIFDNLQKEANAIYKKPSLKPSDLQSIQNFIIMSLLGGIFVPPRRNKDFVDFKIKNINKETDNYISGNKMIFNSYKTAKTYGRQEIIIPPPLKTILVKWIKSNPTDYLLFDVGMNQLSSIKLNQRLNKIFDKKVGVNQLRHTYLTNKFKTTSEDNKAVKKTMTDMGSSSNMLDTYVKLD